MTHSLEESRGSTLAHWTTAVMLALGSSSCVSAERGDGSKWPDGGASADLAAELDVLTDELTQRARLRIPLGSARVFVEEPVAVRPESKRYWPAHWADDEWGATQSVLEFELQVALANRMNVVGMHRHAGDESAPGIALAALDAHTVHADATHALLTTFVHDGAELELTLQLVECDSGWIVATARRRIVGFSPAVYAAQVGPPRPSAAIARVTEAAPVAEHAAEHEPALRTAEHAEHVEQAPSATGDVAAVALDLTTSEPPGSALSGAAEDDLADAALGPAAMRRRALQRIATEVAARVDDGTR